MANIVALEHPDNVTLLAGASQYWSDRPKLTLNADWGPLLAPQVSGRTLIVGWAPEATYRALAQASDELHILQRGIVGSSDAAQIVPSAKVWCGTPQALAEATEPFDTVLCLADVSCVLPLESEEKSWREAVDDVLALAKPGATVCLWVENDLGIHRLLNPHNPRAERSEATWSPMRTFDVTRPLTLDGLRAEFPHSQVYVTWPSAQWTLMADPQTADPIAHAMFADRATAVPPLGPDPVYLLSTAARAGRLTEFVSGWFVMLRFPKPLSSPIYSAEQHRVLELDEAGPAGSRTAFIVFAELAANNDMPGVREFIKDWSTEYEKSNGAASLCLNVVEKTPLGHWQFTPLAGAPDTTDDRWEALGELVSLMRNRNWRGIWPANYTDARILNHLGIMAGLHTVSPARAAQLITPKLIDRVYADSPDVQSMAAAIQRRDEKLTALSSQLSLAQHKITALQETKGGALRIPRKVLRKIKRIISG